MLQVFAILSALTKVNKLMLSGKGFELRRSFSEGHKTITIDSYGTVTSDLPAEAEAIKKINVMGEVIEMIGDLEEDGTAKEVYYYQISTGVYIEAVITVTLH